VLAAFTVVSSDSTGGIAARLVPDYRMRTITVRTLRVLVVVFDPGRASAKPAYSVRTTLIVCASAVTKYTPDLDNGRKLRPLFAA